ncbi:MAG: T9SS type A sorting domain-containing protein, partial [Sphingobacteriales bacterium]
AVADLAGHVVYSTSLPAGVQEWHVVLPALNNGMYIATITHGDDQPIYSKIIIAR